MVHPEQNFIFDSYCINYVQSGIINFVRLEDSEGTNGLTWNLPRSEGTSFTGNITPKLMKGTQLIIRLINAIPINEFITISLFGWYEDK